MRRHPEIDYSRNPFGIPRKDAEPITRKEIEAVNRLLGRPNKSAKEIDKELTDAELLRKLKLYQWKVRQRLLVREVLEASTATDGEKAFLTGEIPTDPNPEHRVRFGTLVRTDEVLHIPFNLDVKSPVFPDLRYMVPHRTGIDALKYAIIPGKIPENQQKTVDKQINLQIALEEAIPMAARASTGVSSEFEYMEAPDQLGSNSWLRVDPYAKRLITYYRLIPRPVPVQSETVYAANLTK